jgi:hypothetical protein
MEEWRSFKQPIFDDSGKGIGFVEDIRYKERVQSACLEVPEGMATIEEKAVLSILPWHRTGGGQKGPLPSYLMPFLGCLAAFFKPNTFFMVGTDSQLMARSRVSNFGEVMCANQGMEDDIEQIEGGCSHFLLMHTGTLMTHTPPFTVRKSRHSFTAAALYSL